MIYYVRICAAVSPLSYVNVIDNICAWRRWKVYTKFRSDNM